MCRRLALGLVAATLALASPPSIRGQQTEAELVQRLDSLRPLLETAERAYQAYGDRAAEAARLRAEAESRVDTLWVGQLAIITPVGQVETARALFTEVWDEHFTAVGRSPALDDVVFTFQWSDDHEPIHVAGPVRPVEVSASVDVAEVKAQTRNVIAAAILADLTERGTRIGRWGAGNPLEPRPFTSTYRIVAMTESQASRACLAGDSAACANAMGLETGTGLEQIEAWYTPMERRSLAARTSYYSMGRIGAGMIGACIQERQLEACDRLLMDSERDLTPFLGPVRETLVAYALAAGGEGAWDRLIEDPEMDVAEALEYASMLPVDQVVSGWLERLRTSRPDVYEQLAPKSGMAVLWTLFFAALALRSTRWRLG